MLWCPIVDATTAGRFDNCMLCWCLYLLVSKLRFSCCYQFRLNFGHRGAAVFEIVLIIMSLLSSSSSSVVP
jgi:hypothetical protein